MSEWRTELPPAEADYILGSDPYAPASVRRWVGDGPSKPYDGPLEVAEVERCFWSYHGVAFDDDGTELTVYALVRLTDGNWAGWGCQDGITWWIGATRDAVVANGLDEEGRRALDLSA